MKLAIVYDWIDKWGGRNEFFKQYLKNIRLPTFIRYMHDYTGAQWARKYKRIQTTFLQNFYRFIPKNSGWFLRCRLLLSHSIFQITIAFFQLDLLCERSYYRQNKARELCFYADEILVAEGGVYGKKLDPRLPASRQGGREE